MLISPSSPQTQPPQRHDSGSHPTSTGPWSVLQKMATPYRGIFLEDPRDCQQYVGVAYGLLWARVPLLCVHTHQGKQFDIQFLFIEEGTRFSPTSFLLNPKGRPLWTHDLISARRSIDSILFGSRVKYAVQATCAILKAHNGMEWGGISEGEERFWVVFRQVRGMARRNRVYGTLKGYPGGAAWLLLTLSAFQHLAFLILHRKKRRTGMEAASLLFSAAYVGIFLDGVRWDSEQLRCWGALDAHSIVSYGVKVPVPGGTTPTLQFTGICDIYNNFLFHATLRNLNVLNKPRRMGEGPYLCVLSYDTAVVGSDWAVWCSLLEREADRIPGDYSAICSLRLFPQTFKLHGEYRCLVLVFELESGPTPSIYEVCEAETSLWYRLSDRIHSVSVGNRLDSLRSPNQGVLAALPCWIKTQALDWFTKTS
jgi:hypothetical protein